MSQFFNHTPVVSSFNNELLLGQFAVRGLRWSGNGSSQVGIYRSSLVCVYRSSQVCVYRSSQVCVYRSSQVASSSLSFLINSNWSIYSDGYQCIKELTLIFKFYGLSLLYWLIIICMCTLLSLMFNPNPV